MCFHIHEVQEQAKLTNGDPIRAVVIQGKVAARWVLGAAYTVDTHVQIHQAVQIRVIKFILGLLDLSWKVLKKQMRKPQPSVSWGLLALPEPTSSHKTQASAPSLLPAAPPLPLPHSHLHPDTAAQGSHRHGSRSREWITLWSTHIATQAAVLSQEPNNLYRAHLGGSIVPICPPFSCLGFFFSFFTQHNSLCFVFACSIANATLSQHVQEEFFLSFHTSRPVHS